MNPLTTMLINKFRRYLTFRNLYLVILAFMAGSLPLSKYTASLSQFLLAIAWLAEGHYGEKWRRLKSRPQILIFTLVFFVPLTGLLWTKNIPFGLANLRIALPFLVMPLVLGSIKKLDDREMKFILGTFVAGVLIGALVSLSIMLGFGPTEYTGDRSSVLFISHIRFALMVVMAVFILFYYTVEPGASKRFRILPFVMALFLTGFLFMLKSLTGVVILVTGGMLLLLRWGWKQQDLIARWFIVVGVATVPVLAAMYLSAQSAKFYTDRQDTVNPARVTALGNPYWHDTTNLMTENGYHVGWYQCETELREAWNKVSKLDYDGPDLKGQELKYTLRRYLTSMGLRKDAHGVSQMKPEDIRLVEEGYPNCLYRHPGRFRVRVYETLWEIDQYRKGGNPSGHSVTQRIEYLKTGWAVFREHPLFGVGTGDIKDAFNRKYDEEHSRLDPEWRLLAHNQYLTFLVEFGIVGFLLIMGALILPVVIEKRRNNYFVLLFLLVAFLSMLNEDTLETQAGVAFFIFFYCLFIFAHQPQPASWERSTEGAGPRFRGDDTQ
jgi:hypothetical protein